MPGKEDHIALLIKKHWLDALSPAEAEELDQWKAENPLYSEFFQHIGTHEYFTDSQQRFAKVRKSEIAKRISEEFPLINSDEENVVAPIHRIHPLKTRIRFLQQAWLRYAAIFLFIAGVIYIWKINMRPPSALISVKQNTIKKEVSPGIDQAILTLSNGQQVVLRADEVKNIDEGKLTIKNRAGELIYGPANDALVNTMSTPKGGQYKLTLPDGTKVWLNAASSITFPTAFINSTREVTIKGEAYLEVAQNARMPFIVHTEKDKITVLGTAFNIDDYPGDDGSKISLVNGSIRVNSLVLIPGEALRNGKLIKTNIEQDIAWKNGKFNFDHVKLKDALGDVSRWYDIEINYANGVPDVELWGTLSRNLPLKHILEALQNAGVKFQFNNRILTVFP